MLFYDGKGKMIERVLTENTDVEGVWKECIKQLLILC